MKAWKITQRLHLTQGQNWIHHNEGRTIQRASWDVLLGQIWSASVLRRLKRATFSCQNKLSSYRTEPARRSESKNKQRVSVLLAGPNDVECRKTIWCEGRQLESNLAGASDSKRCVSRRGLREIVADGNVPDHRLWIKSLKTLRSFIHWTCFWQLRVYGEAKERAGHRPREWTRVFQHRIRYDIAQLLQPKLDKFFQLLLIVIRKHSRLSGYQL